MRVSAPPAVDKLCRIRQGCPNEALRVATGENCMFAKVRGFKDGLVEKYDGKIRERAITQTKARIALSERNFEDFTEDELEVIVKDEEDKVKRGMKQSLVVAVLITLGLS